MSTYLQPFIHCICKTFLKIIFAKVPGATYLIQLELGAFDVEYKERTEEKLPIVFQESCF